MVKPSARCPAISGTRLQRGVAKAARQEAPLRRVVKTGHRIRFGTPARRQASFASETFAQIGKVFFFAFAYPVWRGPQLRSAVAAMTNRHQMPAAGHVLKRMILWSRCSG